MRRTYWYIGLLVQLIGVGVIGSLCLSLLAIKVGNSLANNQIIAQPSFETRYLKEYVVIDLDRLLIIPLEWVNRITENFDMGWVANNGNIAILRRPPVEISNDPLKYSQNLLTLNFDDGTVGQSIFFEYQPYGVGWSSDGNWIAFSGYRNEVVGLYVADSNLENMNRIVDLQAVSLSWSPDNKHIAFRSKYSNNLIYIISSDGSNLRRFEISNTISMSLGVWSPTSEYLTFTTDTPSIGYESIIYIINLSEGEIKQLTSIGEVAYGENWSPDGRHLVYMSDHDGEHEIYMTNVENNIQYQLTRNYVRDGLPVWSPDGQHIAFIVYQNFLPQIHIMNANGSNQQFITDIPISITSFGWSPNSQKILFSDSYAALYMVDINTKEIQKIGFFHPLPENR